MKLESVLFNVSGSNGDRVQDKWVMAVEMQTQSVLDIIFERAGLFQSRAAVATYRDGLWHQLSFEQLRLAARNLSNYLINFGIKRGDKIAIMSESSGEFGIVFFACIRAGAILVPLDPKLTPTELDLILADCRPRLIFASDASSHLASETLKECQFVEEIIVTDLDASPEFETIAEASSGQKHCIGIERDLDDVALIVYTSGSSGAPKGVMTTFGNLIFQSETAGQLFEASEQDVFLSILPMNHLLEFTVGFLGALYAGAQICYLPSLFPDDILRAIETQRVTYMVVVPAFMRLLKGAIERRREKAPSTDVRSILGSQFRGFICGGAPLGYELAEFFDGLGIKVFTGYGMTETSPIISTNTHRNFRLGSVGKPLAGVEVRIAAVSESSDETEPALAKDTEEGEILTRGPHVMHGYYQNSKLTEAVIDDEGWLSTGDIGRIDDDGFLYITGRKKELIVLPGGKKVQPEEVETVLSRCSLVKEVCVIGLKKPPFAPTDEEVVAVVVPTSASIEDCVVEEAVKEVQQELAAYKRPARCIVWRQPLPRTHTFKLKRAEVARMLALPEVTTR